MKHVLLPTDLSVQSLWPINEIIQSHAGEEQLVIHVIHMIEIPNSIHDLMFLGRNKNNIALPSSFNDALCVLKNKYARPSVSIKFDFLYGSSYKILRNFIQGRGIEAIYLLEKYTYHFSSTKSINFTPFIKKIKTPVNYIAFNNGIFSEFQILSIFLNHSENDVKNDSEIKELNLSIAMAN